MEKRNWQNINEELDKIYFDIFKNINVNSLNKYEKRKIIFEYLCNNVKYDYELLDSIKLNHSNPNYKIGRQPYLEIESVLKNKKGICNAIAQVYKLLLEKVGIYSLCVICDDGTDIKHQLNLVYDDENDSFSFDDITSVIVNRGNIDEFFDYDIESANNKNQGNKVAYKDSFWLCLPTSYIYTLIGRDENEYLKYNIEPIEPGVIPNNISSSKNNKKRT